MREKEKYINVRTIYARIVHIKYTANEQWNIEQQPNFLDTKNKSATEIPILWNGYVRFGRFAIRTASPFRFNAKNITAEMAVSRVKSASIIRFDIQPAIE